MKKVLFTITICFFSQFLPGQTAIWTGLGDGLSWEDPDNWMPDQVPQTGDSTVIENDSVVLNTNADLKNLLLNNSAILNILSDGSIKFSGSLNYALRANNSKVYNAGTVLVLDVGNFDVGDRAIELLSGSSFRNDGNFQIDETTGHGIWLESESTFDNNGVVNIHSAGDIAISVAGLDSKFINNNTIGITTFGISVTNSGELRNMGSIDIQTSGNGIYTFDGQILNYGDIDIFIEGLTTAINLRGSTPRMDVLDGTITIHLNNGNGIYLGSGTLTLAAGVTVTISGTAAEYRMNIDSDAELDCQGTLDLQ